MELKDYPIIIGDLEWEELRALLVIELINCTTEKEFIKVAMNLAASVGDINQIQRIRKELGIKPLNRQEIDDLDKKSL